MAERGHGVVMISTARQVGVNSPHFLWSGVICAVVFAEKLTFRYLTERRSGIEWATPEGAGRNQPPHALPAASLRRRRSAMAMEAKKSPRRASSMLMRLGRSVMQRAKFSPALIHISNASP